MGTGSHRPQWEAAKGRPDVLGGIKHARALKSHTKLKYRQPLEIKTPPKLIETVPKHASDTNSSNVDHTYNQKEEYSDDDDDDDDEEDEEDELKKELAILDKRNKLRSKLEPKQAKTSKWKSEALFKRKPKKASNGFLDKYVR